jgi:predicted small lipoprotein YifL
VNTRRLTGIAMVVLAASGCGLKGPLYLPEKSEVTIRPAPAATAPEAPTPTTPEAGQESAPEPAATPEPPPPEPQTGPGRG